VEVTFMEIYEEVKEATKPAKDNPSLTKSRMRELVDTVINSDFNIESISILRDEKSEDKSYTGYIEFAIDIFSMGLTLETVQRFRKEIFTTMFVDFVSELIIRENIDLFLAKMSSITMTECQTAVGNRRHETTGMAIKANSMVFTFHISLLQELLVSGFKRKL
jgi:hypothetical protein